MGNLKLFAPPLISFLLGLGLQVSGYQNPQLAWLCFALAGVLMVIPLWDYCQKLGCWWSNPLSVKWLGFKRKSNWIPLLDAPFLLNDRPELFAEEDIWSEEFLIGMLAGARIDKQPNPPGMSFNPSYPAAQNKYGHDLVYVGINWEKRSFVWRWGFMMDGKMRVNGLSVSPWALDVQEFLTAFLKAETWAMLKAHAEFTWRHMTDPVMNSISAGRLEIWARFGSTKAPFEKIDPDSWRHFKIIDWDNGQATSGSEILYSIHLVPKTDGLIKKIQRLCSGARIENDVARQIS
jgi:hypothetical protein